MDRCLLPPPPPLSPLSSCSPSPCLVCGGGSAHVPSPERLGTCSWVWDLGMSMVFSLGVRARRVGRRLKSGAGGMRVRARARTCSFWTRTHYGPPFHLLFLLSVLLLLLLIWFAGAVRDTEGEGRTASEKGRCGQAWVESAGGMEACDCAGCSAGGMV